MRDSCAYSYFFHFNNEKETIDPYAQVIVILFLLLDDRNPIDIENVKFVV